MSPSWSTACFVALIYITVLFLIAWGGLKLLRWDRKRRARIAVEQRVNRSLALYRSGTPRVEWVAGVRCVVQPAPTMQLPDRLYRIEDREAMTLSELYGRYDQ